MQNTVWLDRAAYPFVSRSLELDAGRMHYIDEGHGPPVVLVHGTPTWSFLYRDLIKRLSASHRCIAVDHLGFGLSDKPAGWTYRPEDHARNLQTAIEQLGLRDFSLIVHDYGGPIGLSYAVEHPENVARLVLCNTFMWSMTGEFELPPIAKVMAGPIGKLLYTRMNFSPRVILPAAWINKATLTPAVHKQYLAVHARPAERESTWALARELFASGAWYDSLWARRDRIKELPALLVWGLKDPAFPAKFLARWQSLFSNAQTVALPTVGHFVTEEAAPEVASAVSAFLAGAPLAA